MKPQKALFVNGTNYRIDTPERIEKLAKEILATQPDALVDIDDPFICHACGTAHFDERDATFCGCL